MTADSPTTAPAPATAPAPVPEIDAHHHVWDVERREHGWLAGLPALDRTFDLDDLRPLAAAAGVDGTVLVQVLAQTGDTEDFLALAARHPLVRGVVGWVDLTGPDVASELARLRSLPGGDRLVGVRHLAQDEPDPRWLVRPDVLAGLAAVAEADLAYDVLVRHHQLPAAVELAERVPALRLVLDHLGKPDVAAGALDPWREQVRALAAHPQVSAKLSGLVTEAGEEWDVERLRPFAGHLLDAFGPQRVMSGSDWPVSTLAAPYAEVLAVNRQLVAGLTPGERADVLGGTATRVYRLTPLSSAATSVSVTA